MIYEKLIEGCFIRAICEMKVIQVERDLLCALHLKEITLLISVFTIIRNSARVCQSHKPTHHPLLLPLQR